MVCQSLVRDSLITRFNFVDPDRRVLTRLECTCSIRFIPFRPNHCVCLIRNKSYKIYDLSCINCITIYASYGINRILHIINFAVRFIPLKLYVYICLLRNKSHLL